MPPNTTADHRIRPRNAQASSLRSLGGFAKARGVEPCEVGWVGSMSMKVTRVPIQTGVRSAEASDSGPAQAPRSFAAILQIPDQITGDPPDALDLPLPFWSPPRGASLLGIGTRSKMPEEE